MTEFKLGMTLHLDTDHTIPEAKRGHVFVGHCPMETTEQLAANLVWWPCSFCGAYVLVASDRPTREKCTCGARRCYHNFSEGWRKGEETWWFC